MLILILTVIFEQFNVSLLKNLTKTYKPQTFEW